MGCAKAFNRKLIVGIVLGIKGFRVLIEDGIFESVCRIRYRCVSDKVTKLLRWKLFGLNGNRKHFS